jgi:hypothetical protein
MCFENKRKKNRGYLDAECDVDVNVVFNSWKSELKEGKKKERNTEQILKVKEIED